MIAVPARDMTPQQHLDVAPHFGTPEHNAILDLLFRHMQKPGFSFRYSWNEGDLLIWDQRAVPHYAVRDYAGRRVIHRIAVLPAHGA